MRDSHNTQDTTWRHKIGFSPIAPRKPLSTYPGTWILKKWKITPVQRCRSEGAPLSWLSLPSHTAGGFTFFGKMLIDKTIWPCELREQGNKGSIKSGGWRWVWVGRGEKSKYLQLTINHETLTEHKKPSIIAGKGLVGVERSKGWVMLEGLSTPRGQIWPVPEWDETRVSHRFCSPELDLWVSSLLLLTVYPEKKKRLNTNGPGVTPRLLSILHPEW